MQFVDSEGSLEQVKWAADVISNLRMRGADGDGEDEDAGQCREESKPLETQY